MCESSKTQADIMVVKIALAISFLPKISHFLLLFLPTHLEISTQVNSPWAET